MLNKIIGFNTLNVVGIFRKEEGDSYFLLKTKKKESKLDILTTSSFLNIEDLVANLDTKIPLIVLIDGKGILNKKIDPKNETDNNWIKNLDYSSIHYTSHNSLDLQILSFCRKNVVEENIDLFKKRGFQILDFYVGPLIAVLLNDSLKTNKIFSNDSILEFEGTEVTNVFKSKEQSEIKKYDIGSTPISGYHIPLYGAAIHFYIKQKSISKSISKEINPEEIVYKKAFNIFGLTMIVTFFILLLTSYLLTQYYNSKNADLNLENVYSNQSYQLIQDLEKQKENKLKILNETGFTSSKFISFYGYELSKSTPAEINLASIDIFPLKKEIKSNEKANFTTRSIVIKGFTYNESIFNSWLENLRALTWINNFEIISFKKDKKNISHFELKIALKNV